MKIEDNSGVKLSFSTHIRMKDDIAVPVHSVTDKGKIMVLLVVL